MSTHIYIYIYQHISKQSLRCLLQDADDDFITMNNDRCRFNDLAIAVNLQTCFYIFQYILPFLEMSCFF